MKRKRAVTLIEIMIVILLIGLIGGVLAWNFKGSLDQGKEFKSREGSERIKNILMLAVLEGQAELSKVETQWKDYLKASPLTGKYDKIIVDGWGMEYKVGVKGDEIEVLSPGLEAKKEAKKEPIKQSDPSISK